LWMEQPRTPWMRLRLIALLIDLIDVKVEWILILKGF
jgi:hypothetical protein